MKEYWKVKKLGEVCEVINGFAFKSTLFKDDGEPILRISNIQNGIITLENVVYFEKKDYKVKLDKYKVYPNDILIALSGATTGKVGVNRTNLELYLNQRVALCREKEFHLRGYLYYFLQTKTKELLSLAGGVAQPNLSTEQIKNLDIYSPSLDEQFRIVEELDLLSNIIEKKRQQLSELDNLAQSIFYDMFGDPVTNEKGWEVKTIEEVCLDIIRGPFGSALKKEYFVPKGLDTYKVYEQKHAIQKDVSLGAYYISSDRYQSMMRFTVYENDIIMSCSGTIGEMFIIPHNAEVGIINQALLLFRLSNVVDKTFFMNVMNAVKSSMETRGAGIQNIGSVKYIKQIGVACPPLSLQQLFAQKIETIEKQKALIKVSIAETEELFNSRMDYYFS